MVVGLLAKKAAVAKLELHLLSLDEAVWHNSGSSSSPWVVNRRVGGPIRGGSYPNSLAMDRDDNVLRTCFRDEGTALGAVALWMKMSSSGNP